MEAVSHPQGLNGEEQLSEKRQWEKSRRRARSIPRHRLTTPLLKIDSVLATDICTRNAVFQAPGKDAPTA